MRIRRKTAATTNNANPAKNLINVFFTNRKGNAIGIKIIGSNKKNSIIYFQINLMDD